MHEGAIAAGFDLFEASLIHQLANFVHGFGIVDLAEALLAHVAEDVSVMPVVRAQRDISIREHMHDAKGMRTGTFEQHPSHAFSNLFKEKTLVGLEQVVIFK